MRRALPFFLALLLHAFPVQSQVMCTMEAKLCPDGSYVSRTGPNCEFSPCPGQSSAAPVPYPVQPEPGTDAEPEDAPGGAPGVQPGFDGDDTGSIEDGYGIVKPEFAAPFRRSALPDEPLDGPVQDPLTVQFLVEHRSALNGKQVNIHGIIVGALLGEDACPANRGACAQPRITLADTTVPQRDRSYDVVVLLPEGDNTPYAPGQIVDISGTVSASPDGVTIQK